MSVFGIDKKAIETEQRILNDPLYYQERPIVVDLIQRLQEAKTANDYFELQRLLIVRLRSRQEIAGQLQAMKQDLQAEIAALARLDPKPLEDIRDKQQELGLRQQQRLVSEALRWILISIGDGMAWKVLGYDRAALTVLGMGERVARFADPAGFDAEAAEMERLWSEGSFPIHNDLTTCLRLGDLTVIHPGDNAVSIVEVKASKELGQSSSQLKRMQDATTLINEGRVQLDAGTVNVQRLRLPYRTHLAHLRDLIQKARADGHAAAKVGTCQFVTVVDYHADVSETELALRQTRTRARVGWFQEDAKLFQWVFSSRRMRDRRYSFSGLAPVPIFPLKAEDLADLTMGFMDVMVVLNADILAGGFRGKGIAVKISTPLRTTPMFFCAQRAASRSGNCLCR
jgi:hypothetical protein